MPTQKPDDDTSRPDLARLCLDVDLQTIDNAVLRQLIAEVRQDDEHEASGRAFNRTHNRHNRGTLHRQTKKNDA